MPTEMKPQVKWTDDCQGKKDYDGNVLSFSCRYWPRGGSADLLQDGVWQPKDQSIKPSATAILMLRFNEDGYRNISESDFEAETEEEVKALVEKWVDTKFAEVCTLFGVINAD